MNQTLWAVKRALLLIWDRAFPTFARSFAPVVAACALFYALPQTLLLLAAHFGSGDVASARSIMTFLTNVCFRPALCAWASFAIAGLWEGRAHGLRALRAFVKPIWHRVWITGLVAYLLSLAGEAAFSLLPLVFGFLDTLLGWIPAVGALFTALHAVMSFIASWLTRFLPAALSMWLLLPLMSDALWGRAQAKEALRLVWGGRPDVFWALGFVALGWCLYLGLSALIPGGLWAGIGRIALETVLLALSLSCVAGLYLSERDRQDGPRLHVYEGGM